MAYPKGAPKPEGSGKKKGTKSPGSGPKPEWLKTKCQKIVEDKELIEFLAAVASGEPFVEKCAIMNPDGNKGKVFEKTRESADVKDRLKAVEMLMDRGWGKPAQAVEVSGEVKNYVFALPNQDKGESGGILD